MTNSDARPGSGARSFSPLRYWIAPYRREEVVTYRLDMARLAAPLRIVVLSDFHAGAPFMPLSRVARIVAGALSLRPDLVLLPGDFRAEDNGWQRPLAMPDLAAALTRLLDAPLGAFASLGNHDWWDHPETQIRRAGPVPFAEVLEEAGIPVLSNRHVTLRHGGAEITLAGLESQTAIQGPTSTSHRGLDDLDSTLAGAPGDRVTLMMAHEPGIFARLATHERRVDLTVSGHTHAGQVQVLGRPLIQSSPPSRDYCHGLFSEGERHLVVSAGLGCSRLPLRLGVVPEITAIDLVPT